MYVQMVKSRYSRIRFAPDRFGLRRKCRAKVVVLAARPIRPGSGSASLVWDPIGGGADFSSKNHKAGLVCPAILLWSWFARSCFDRRPRMSFLPYPRPRLRGSQPNRLRSFTQPVSLELFLFARNHRSPIPYITIARFSNSCWRTGRAQPAISTRPAASSAAFGETPYPRPIRNTWSNSAASYESIMPPWSKSFRRAASSVIVNLSLSFIALSIMAVITSDSDLVPLYRIRLIGSCVSCMQFGCRICLSSLVRSPIPVWMY